jgi:hypothetical protein
MRIARSLLPASKGKRRAAQTTAGMSSDGTYHSPRFNTSSLPAWADIPGFRLISVYR